MAGCQEPDLIKAEEGNTIKNNNLDTKPPTSGRINRLSVNNVNISQEHGNRQLSYVNLACCITGYTDLTRYNSRLREGFRSREASPARFILDSSSHTTKDMSCLRSSVSTVETTTKTSETYVSTSDNVSSSFIKQRIERLYGTTAVTEGVQQKFNSNSVITSSTTTCTEKVTITSNNHGENLPVMKLLRPEFLAQFEFRSPRTPVSKFSSRLSKERSPEDQSEKPKYNGNSTHSIANDITPNGNSNSHTKIDSNGDSVDGTTLKIKTVPVKLFSSNLADEKDGHYYLKLLKNEVECLHTLSQEYQEHLAHVNEDVADLIRSAVGKAQLLCNQKLKQFEGLCHKNINQTPDEPYQTTSEDLGGFWDLVVIQIDSAKLDFSKLEKIKLAGWVIADEKVPKIVNGTLQKKTELNNNAKNRRSKPGAQSNKPTEKVKKQREDLRKKIAEERKKMALQKDAALDSDILLV